MPLARITTRLAQDSQALANDLRARGFEVQTKSPDEAPSETADLEIALEECASEEALGNATNDPDARDFWVFIAPGAITENLRPIETIPLNAEPAPGSVAFLAQADAESPAGTMHSALPAVVEAAAAIPVHAKPALDLLISQSVAAAHEETDEQPTVVYSAEASEQAVPLGPRFLPLVQKAVSRGRVVRDILRRRIFSSDKLFWKTATVVSLAAVAVLLTGASLHRFLPLPKGVVWHSEEEPQQVPFDRTKPVHTVPAATKVLTTEAPMAARSATRQPVQPATPSSAPTRVVKSKPRRSTHNDADFVAEDTVIRYGKRRATHEDPGKTQASK
jgi:hypothetical protein